MVKCPECGAEIEHLIYWENTPAEYYFIVDNEELGEYEPIKDSLYANDIHYSCPECGTVLFSSELTATDFLTETGQK